MGIFNPWEMWSHPIDDSLYSKRWEKYQPLHYSGRDELYKEEPYDVEKKQKCLYHFRLINSNFSESNDLVILLA